MNIVEFLTACIDEDERIAKAAVTGNGEWRMHDHDSDTVIVYDSTREPVVYNEGWPSDEQASLIAQQDPARTLRRVAAYRAILAAYERVEREEDMLELTSSAYWAGLEFAVKTLAAEFEDRPGFNPQWSLT